jgi:hypothetical protein
MIIYRIFIFRNQEAQEQNGHPWEAGVRITKTSEDRYVRSDSTSSRSSVDEPIPSPKSNIYNSSSMHQSTGKQDFNRVFILILFR